MGAFNEFWFSLGPFFGAMVGIFWVWMLIDCLSRAKVRNQRVLWFILLLVFNWMGALVYFFTYVFPMTPVFRHGSTPVRQAPKKTSPPQAARPAPRLYQSYRQGYQAYQPTYSSGSTPASSPYQQEEQHYAASYYEQPQAIYPELPQQH